MLGLYGTTFVKVTNQHILCLPTYWAYDVQREKRGGGELPGGGGAPGQGAPGQHPQERKSGKNQGISGLVFVREDF